MEEQPAALQNVAHSSTADAKLCAFINALATTGIVTDSAAIAGFSRKYAYEIKEKDADFSARWDDALEQACDLLEREARRRALEGVTRKLFYKGTPVLDPETGTQYIEHHYSDGLLTKLLAAHRPNKFGDKSKVELTGKDGEAFKVYLGFDPNSVV